MHDNFIAQLNAVLHPLRSRLNEGQRAEAHGVLSNAIMIDVPSLKDGRAGWMLEPSFTVAHRLWKVTLDDGVDGAGLRGFSGVPALHLRFTAREVLTLVREHVRSYLRRRGIAEPDWTGYIDERIDPTTNLLWPERLLDAE